MKFKCTLTVSSRIEVYFPMYDYLGNAIFDEDLGIGQNPLETSDHPPLEKTKVPCYYGPNTAFTAATCILNLGKKFDNKDPYITIEGTSIAGSLDAEIILIFKNPTASGVAAPKKNLYLTVLHHDGTNYTNG